MRPVSDAFLRAVRGSHAMSARARVVTAFATGTDPDGTDIDVIAGDVHLDSTAAVRSTLSLATSGSGMWPSRDNTLLAPYGNEIFIERGMQFGGGTTEWCSLGYFRIDGPDQDVAPDQEIVISGSDRMAGIRDGQLVAPRQFTSAQTYGDVVDALVLEIYPSATVEWDDSTDADTIGRDILVEQDRYGALKDLVTSVGKVAYWDHRGVLVIKDPPDPGAPVFDVTHGADGVLVEMSRELSRVGVYNGVVVIGEGADTEQPARGLQVDSNPASPTFWGGPFGKVPRFHFSPLVVDDVQAMAAAAAMLRQALGLPYSVDFGMVPNPALEPLDPIRVSYSDRHGAEFHVVETLTIPLVADAAMTGTTREKTLIIVGAG